jgi:hypothetical protein
MKHILPIMSGITLAVQNHVSMLLMDIVTTYLYRSLDSNIYMKVPNGIPILNPKASRTTYCVKLNKSMYGVKQSG